MGNKLYCYEECAEVLFGYIITSKLINLNNIKNNVNNTNGANNNINNKYIRG